MTDSNRAATVVRLMEPADLEAAATLHHASLPDSFFSSLGVPYLIGCYESFVSSPYALALTCERNGRFCGFLVGTWSDSAHYPWVIRHRRKRLAGLALRQLLTRPRIAAHFLRTRARRYIRGLRSLNSSASASELRSNGTLNHIAVSRSDRGAGAGSALVARYVELATANGAEDLRLLTLANDLGASGFYLRLGWTPDGTTTDVDGKRFRRFQKSVSSGETADS